MISPPIIGDENSISKGNGAERLSDFPSPLSSLIRNTHLITLQDQDYLTLQTNPLLISFKFIIKPFEFQPQGFNCTSNSSWMIRCDERRETAQRTAKPSPNGWNLEGTGNWEFWCVPEEKKDNFPRHYFVFPL